MIVYAEREEIVDTRQEFRRRIEAATEPRERFILQGQFEAGIADAICTDFDQIVDLTRSIPERITIRPQEGYAITLFTPRCMREAAEAFSPRSNLPARVSSSAFAVSARACRRSWRRRCMRTWRFTVRPRGHPFDREIRLSEALETAIRRNTLNRGFSSSMKARG